MITPITFPTALKYWLQAASISRERYSFEDLDIMSVNMDISVDALIRSAQIFHIEQPIHVIVEKPEFRHFSSLLCTHVLPGNLPAGSFIRLTDSLFIISPECCLLLAAQNHTLPELVCMANDLCAIYRRDSISALGQSSRTLLTNVSVMGEYLDRAVNMKGLKKAKNAVKYAVDRSNSPMESKLAALCCMPLVKGGFGLPKPLMNHEVTLSENAAAFLERDKCCVDMLWELPKVVVEYDSNLTHLSRDQHYYDKKRSTALSLSGYTVISITSDHFRSHSSIDKLCLDLRSALGIRTYMDRFSRYSKIRHETVETIIYGRVSEQNLRL